MSGKNKRPKQPFSLEQSWEAFLWATRFLVLIAVVFGLAASLMLFVLGAWDVGKAVLKMVELFSGHGGHEVELEILSGVIGAVDTFLIAVVVLIFGFGLYELFISRIEPAQGSEVQGILKIPNLESLKDKIASVIIMALVVKFFQIVLTLPVLSLLDSLLYACGVALLALSVLLLQIGQRLLAKLKQAPGKPEPSEHCTDGSDEGPAAVRPIGGPQA